MLRGQVERLSQLFDTYSHGIGLIEFVTVIVHLFKRSLLLT